MPQIDGVADHAAENLEVGRLVDTADATASPASVEPKVKAATAAATVATFLLWVLGTYVFRGEVPLPVQGIVALVVTGGGTFVAGYLARHVNRSS